MILDLTKCSIKSVLTSADILYLLRPELSTISPGSYMSNYESFSLVLSHPFKALAPRPRLINKEKHACF